MVNFCTLFDSNYLSRGLAMYSSLLEHSREDINLFIICLDDQLFEFFSEHNYKSITSISYREIEAHFNELKHARNNRTFVEYIFTLSPVIPLFIFQKYSNVNVLTTLDADIFFFSDPTELVKSIEASIAVTPHAFNKHFKFLEKYGKYNVSFQTFKRDEFGIKCLEKWKADCLEWCYDRHENDKFADQKYLDEWENLYYPYFKEYGKGAGVAPWNVNNDDISADNKGNIFIKSEPLIYYHFHGMRNITDNWIALGLFDYWVFKRKKIVKNIYSKYVESICENTKVFKSNKIHRGTHPKFGKVLYNLILADVYYYSRDRNKLIRICNFNILRFLYSYFKNKLINKK